MSMRQLKEELVLRHYIENVVEESYDDPRCVLVEGNFIRPEQLGKMFGFDGIKNALKIALGRTKEIARNARTALDVATRVILTTIVPGIKENYAGIFEKEKEDIKKIRESYRDASDAVNKVYEDPDVAMLAFMINPTIAIGAKLAVEAPGAARKALDAVTGGISEEVIEETKEKLEDAGMWAVGESDKAKEKRQRDREYSKRRGGIFGSRSEEEKDDLFARVGKKISSALGAKQEGHIREADEDDEKEKKKPKKKYTVEDLLKSEKFLNVVKKRAAGELEKSRSEAIAAYKGSLDEAVKYAENVLKKAKTIQEIVDGMKKKDPKIVKALEDIKKLPEEDRAPAEKSLLTFIRSNMKISLMEPLSKKITALQKAGFDDDNQMVKDYKEAMAKIQAM